MDTPGERPQLQSGVVRSHPGDRLSRPGLGAAEEDEALITALCFPGLVDEGSLLPPDEAFSSEAIAAIHPAIEAAYGTGGMAAWKRSLATAGFADPAQHVAVLLWGLAAHLTFQRDHPEPVSVTGHSLGIYAAAVAAGSLTAGSAVRLVLVAGDAIERAQRAGASVLLAVTGLTRPELEDLLAAGEAWKEVRITHYNSTVQHLVSGREDTLRGVARRCLESGAFGATILPFPGAVHREDLAVFADEFFAEVDETEFRAPTSRFYSPVSARLVTTADEARTTILDQLTRPVRFAETILNMAPDGNCEFVVLGPCARLGSLIGWIHREARVSLFPDIPGDAGDPGEARR